MLAVGDTVAEFSLLDHLGHNVKWSSLRGRKVVFFFYPKANTPGCTKEAIAFRDLQEAFDSLGVALYGVSADTVKRQSNFVAKHTLSMPLLSDPEHHILEPWGIWGEKRNYGRTYQGIIRSTVFFDEAGVVLQVWHNLRVKGHAEAVLEAARAAS